MLLSCSHRISGWTSTAVEAMMRIEMTGGKQATNGESDVDQSHFDHRDE